MGANAKQVRVGLVWLAVMVGLALVSDTAAFAPKPIAQAPESPEPADESSPPPVFGLEHVDTWQSRPVPPLGVIVDPVRIRSLADGSLLVTDRELHRVQRFDPNGQPLADYGRRGVDDGQLLYPMGAAADLDRSRLYVADTGNDRLVVFDLAGDFVANWSTGPTPADVVVGPQGQVAVYDGNQTVVVFSPEGEKENTFLAGNLRRIDGLIGGGIDMDRFGRLFVGAHGGVGRYSPEGQFERLVRLQSDQVRDVTLDPDGDLYALDLESRIHWFLIDQTFRRHLGGDVRSIAAGTDRTLYAAKGATRDRRGGIVEVRVGDVGDQSRWGDPLEILGWLAYPLRVSGTPAEELLLVDDIFRVQRFEPSGDALGQLSLPGLLDAAALPDGDLVVIRQRFGTSSEDPEDPEVPPPGTRRFVVERLDFARGFVSERDRPAEATVVWRHDWIESRDERPNTRFAGLALRPVTGDVYVLDAGRQRVLAWTADGDPLPGLALPDLGAGLPAYMDLLVQADGRLAMLHTAARRLMIFELPDTHAPDAPALPAEVRQVPEWSWRMAPLSTGAMAMVTGSGWVVVVDPEGQVVGSRPLPESEFDTGEPPTDIGVDGDDRIYVTDRSAAAVFVFELGSDVRDRPPTLPEPRQSCRLAAAGAVEPVETLVGTAVTVTVGITGECDPHPRLRQPPVHLAQTVVVSASVPEGIEVVPGSVEPDAEYDSRVIRWRLTNVGHAGLQLRYRLRPTEPGRRPGFAALTGDVVDGWFGRGRLEGTSAYFLIRPKEATPAPTPERIWLPALRTVSAPHPTGSD